MDLPHIWNVHNSFFQVDLTIFKHFLLLFYLVLQPRTKANNIFWAYLVYYLRRDLTYQLEECHSKRTKTQKFINTHASFP